jgi:hypothetical protein
MKTPISQWSVPVLASWAMTTTCTFSPHPKSGVQACSAADGSCPHGYVCAADNTCWLPEDLAADAGGAGTGGGTPSAGGTPGVGGATGGSRAAGGAVATGGTSTTGSGTCVAPSTSTLTRFGLAYWVTPSGDLYCTGDVWCPASYPYHCSKTNTCYSTQQGAVANCGSTACSACVATTCQCGCRCDAQGGGDLTMTTCQPGPGDASDSPCIRCCAYRCNAYHLMYYDSVVSSCTVLP